MPAMAVAAALRRDDPSGEVTLVGRRGGVEERLVPAAGLPLRTLSVRGVDVARPLLTARALARMPANVLEARRLIAELRPDVVVGAAGYVCVPVAVAARSRGVPVVLLEQNAVPGRAVRLLVRARVAAVVAASFPQTASRLGRARVVHTGNPLRREVTDAIGAALPERPSRLLVMGGSQGARRINRALAGALIGLLEAWPSLRVTHASGEDGAAEAAALRDSLPEPLRARYRTSPFFDDIAARVAASDLVVMRAGGTSLAEVSALGRPMVLVPYPHAGDHQRHNAGPYVDAGAATVVADAELDPGRLRAEVEGLLRDPGRWRAMAEASRGCGIPDAAERVVALVREAAGVRAR